MVCLGDLDLVCEEGRPWVPEVGWYEGPGRCCLWRRFNSTLWALRELGCVGKTRVGRAHLSVATWPVVKTSVNSFENLSFSLTVTTPSSSSSVLSITFTACQNDMCRRFPHPKIPFNIPPTATSPTCPWCKNV